MNCPADFDKKLRFQLFAVICLKPSPPLVRHIILGFLYALIAAIGFSLLSSLVICCGVNPEARSVSDMVSPLLGIFTGAYFASQRTSCRTGVGIGLFYVALWLGFWIYAMGRVNFVLWVEEGFQHITNQHVIWWLLAIAAGTLGGLLSAIRLISFLQIILIASLGLVIAMYVSVKSGDVSAETVPGFQIERQTPTADGTAVCLMTFDFQKQNQFNVGLYDCDSDDAMPYDDSNTTYMGQSMERLVDKLGHRADLLQRQVLCAINGGFFGASGFSVAHHEMPIVQDGRALYNVDLMRNKDQGWFFAVNAPQKVQPGQPRFSMFSSIPWERLEDYQTVLGGVRPLRVNGNSILLKPGAGSTSLRCSRTSIGWSVDGEKFYVLIVHDPDGEGASQVQREMHQPQTGGWDVNEVQKFWEEKGVPFALLFDGGESTQLAYLRPEGGYHYLSSGYQYSFTIGYLFQRPLLFTLPILPPSEAHRGVLNYLYVTAPVSP